MNATTIAVMPAREMEGSVKASPIASDRQLSSAGGNIPPRQVSNISPVAADKADISAAVADVSAKIEMASTSLSISVDDTLGSTIIQVTDSDTDEVIRQIPPEQIVNLARFLRENSGVEGFELADTMKGLLLDSVG